MENGESQTILQGCDGNEEQITTDKNRGFDGNVGNRTLDNYRSFDGNGKHKIFKKQL